jgi:ankyrin repeat protein
MNWFKKFFGKSSEEGNKPRFEDDESNKRTDVNRKILNVENILEVQCPLCKTKYRIGSDSIITTPEEVLASFSNNIIGSDNAISEFASQPDIIDRVTGNDAIQREKLIISAQKTVLKIREQIHNGGVRYWKCSKCNNNENPTLYSIQKNLNEKKVLKNIDSTDRIQASDKKKDLISDSAEKQLMEYINCLENMPGKRNKALFMGFSGIYKMGQGYRLTKYIDHLNQVSEMTKKLANHIGENEEGVLLLHRYYEELKDWGIKLGTKIDLTKTLIEAVGKGDIDVVKSLLEDKVDINATFNNNITPLFLASEEGYTEIVKSLIEAKADVNSANIYGVTPLIIASEKGHTAIVNALIEAKANVNATTLAGIAPLYIASACGNTEIVNRLIEAEANVDVTDTDGLTTLMKASAIGHTEIVKILIEAKADVDVADKEMVTSLFLASVGGHAEIVKALIEANANVNAAETHGMTPLWIASGSGHTKIVKTLVEGKANVNAAIEIGTTPLRIASEKGHIEIVKTLIEAKADVDAADTSGKSPLQIASEKGHSEIVTLLNELGAKKTVGSS